MSDLGLRRNTVRIVDHRPEWTATFHIEASEILRCIGDIVVDVQHVGSTAVADVPAKPILDIAVATRTHGAIPTVVERLRRLGYIDRGDAGSEGGYLLVKESEPDVRTIHLHIVEVADNQWLNYLKFRDTLRRDPDIRRRYAELKQSLADQCRGERKAYTAGKAALIREILGCAHE
ncbi:MAG TPA: GrpB family protein [Vicinamibacterales bacterium]|nr:GrpB family protein [Vicinamibacterales bacterium]